MLSGKLKVIIAGVDFPFLSVNVNKTNAQIITAYSKAANTETFNEILKHEDIPIMILSKKPDSTAPMNRFNSIVIFEGVIDNIVEQSNPLSNLRNLVIKATKTSIKLLNDIKYSNISLGALFSGGINAIALQNKKKLVEDSIGSSNISLSPDLVPYNSNIMMYKMISGGENIYNVKYPHNVIENVLHNLTIPLSSYAANYDDYNKALKNLLDGLTIDKSRNILINSDITNKLIEYINTTDQSANSDTGGDDSDKQRLKQIHLKNHLFDYIISNETELNTFVYNTLSKLLGNSNFTNYIDTKQYSSYLSAVYTLLYSVRGNNSQINSILGTTDTQYSLIDEGVGKKIFDVIIDNIASTLKLSLGVLAALLSTERITVNGKVINLSKFIETPFKTYSTPTENKLASYINELLVKTITSTYENAIFNLSKQTIQFVDDVFVNFLTSNTRTFDDVSISSYWDIALYDSETGAPVLFQYYKDGININYGIVDLCNNITKAVVAEGTSYTTFLSLVEESLFKNKIEKYRSYITKFINDEAKAVDQSYETSTSRSESLLDIVENVYSFMIMYSENLMGDNRDKKAKLSKTRERIQERLQNLSQVMTMSSAFGDPYDNTDMTSLGQGISSSSRLYSSAGEADYNKSTEEIKSIDIQYTYIKYVDLNLLYMVDTVVVQTISENNSLIRNTNRTFNYEIEELTRKSAVSSSAFIRDYFEKLFNDIDRYETEQGDTIGSNLINVGNLKLFDYLNARKAKLYNLRKRYSTFENLKHVGGKTDKYVFPTIRLSNLNDIVNVMTNSAGNSPVNNTTLLGAIAQVYSTLAYSLGTSINSFVRDSSDNKLAKELSELMVQPQYNLYIPPKCNVFINDVPITKQLSKEFNQTKLKINYNRSLITGQVLPPEQYMYDMYNPELGVQTIKEYESTEITPFNPADPRTTSEKLFGLTQATEIDVSPQINKILQCIKQNEDAETQTRKKIEDAIKKLEDTSFINFPIMALLNNQDIDDILTFTISFNTISENIGDKEQVKFYQDQAITGKNSTFYLDPVDTVLSRHSSRLNSKDGSVLDRGYKFSYLLNKGVFIDNTPYYYTEDSYTGDPSTEMFVISSDSITTAVSMCPYVIDSVEYDRLDPKHKFGLTNNTLVSGIKIVELIHKHIINQSLTVLIANTLLSTIKNSDLPRGILEKASGSLLDVLTVNSSNNLFHNLVINVDRDNNDIVITLNVKDITFPDKYSSLLESFKQALTNKRLVLKDFLTFVKSLIVDIPHAFTPINSNSFAASSTNKGVVFTTFNKRISGSFLDAMNYLPTAGISVATSTEEGVVVNSYTEEYNYFFNKLCLAINRKDNPGVFRYSYLDADIPAFKDGKPEIIDFSKTPISTDIEYKIRDIGINTSSVDMPSVTFSENLSSNYNPDSSLAAEANALINRIDTTVDTWYVIPQVNSVVYDDVLLNMLRNFFYDYSFNLENYASIDSVNGSYVVKSIKTLNEEWIQPLAIPSVLDVKFSSTTDPVEIGGIDTFIPTYEVRDTGVYPCDLYTTIEGVECKVLIPKTGRGSFMEKRARNRLNYRYHAGLDFMPYTPENITVGEWINSDDGLKLISVAEGFTTLRLSTSLGLGVYLLPDKSQFDNENLPVFLYGHCAIEKSIEYMRAYDTRLDKIADSKPEDYNLTIQSYNNFSGYFQTKYNTAKEKGTAVALIDFFLSYKNFLTDKTGKRVRIPKEIGTLIEAINKKLRKVVIRVKTNSTLGFMGHSGECNTKYPEHNLYGAHLHWGIFKVPRLSLKDEKLNVTSDAVPEIIAATNTVCVSSLQIDSSNEGLYSKYLYSPYDFINGKIKLISSEERLIYTNGSVRDDLLIPLIKDSEYDSVPDSNSRVRSYDVKNIVQYYAEKQLRNMRFSVNLPPLTLPYIDPYVVEFLPAVVMSDNDIYMCNINSIDVSANNTSARSVINFSKGYSLRNVLFYLFNNVKTKIRTPQELIKAVEEYLVYPPTMLPEFRNTLESKDSMNEEYRRMFGRSNFSFNWIEYVLFEFKDPDNIYQYMTLYRGLNSKYSDLFMDYILSDDNLVRLFNPDDTYIVIDRDSIRSEISETGPEGQRDLLLNYRSWNSNNLYTLDTWRKHFGFYQGSVQYDDTNINKISYDDSYIDIYSVSSALEQLRSDKLESLQYLTELRNVATDITLAYHDWTSLFKQLRGTII